MAVSKNRGILPPKMDGLFHGKPYEQMDDLGGFTAPIFWKHLYIYTQSLQSLVVTTIICSFLMLLMLSDHPQVITPEV